MEQLSLLNLPLQPPGLPLPVPNPVTTEPIAAPKSNQSEIDWIQISIRYYEKLQVRFFNLGFQANCAGTAKPAIQAMRQQEISRLQGLINDLKIRLEAMK